MTSAEMTIKKKQETNKKKIKNLPIMVVIMPGRKECNGE